MENLRNIVYVCGHRYPDTDSIVSAIAYANLKQQLGINAIACRLGELNAETKYLLDRFNVTAPSVLKDARATLEEIAMDDVHIISLDTTIREVMTLMDDHGRQTFAVVNERNQLLGVVTSSNIAKVAMGDTALNIDLLSRTSIENIAKTVDGKLVYAPLDFSFNGKVSIVAIASTKLENYELKGRLVIIGNDVESQITAIKKGASCIVTVWTDVIAPHVIELAREYKCAIIMSSHGTLNTSRYIYFSPIVKEVMTTDLVYFNKAEYVEEVSKKMMKSRFRSYPVVDDENRIYGFISRYHVLNSRNKRLILVDHNEYAQSIEGAEDADIIEVIDHHRIGDITTSKPISFRNEIIGSTASIITKLYQEADVTIPKEIAALLLGAMISDTLNFKSPTTTPKDIELGSELARISELDLESYSRDIFGVTSSFATQDYADIITQDIKTFTISNQRVMVSQVVVYEFGELSTIIDQFVDAMDAFVLNRGLDLLVVVITSVSDNGSYIFGSGKLKQAVADAFPNKKGEKFSFFSEVVSRKNQIIPRLSVAISQQL